MSLPVLSILAFGLAIFVSCISEINVGFLSIALAFIIGIFFGDMRVADVVAGFIAGRAFAGDFRFFLDASL